MEKCTPVHITGESWNTAGQEAPVATTPAMSASGRQAPWRISLKTGNTRSEERRVGKECM